MQILSCMIDLSEGAGASGLDMSFGDGAAFATSVLMAEGERQH
jgi:hypothetical protein